MIRTALAFLLVPTALTAGEWQIEDPIVPLAPPGVMAHAAYFTLTNTSDAPRQLIGVTADGYRMAHIHRTEVKDDIATMSAVDVIEIAPGQSVAFDRGGLHVMLMQPTATLAEGSTIGLTLEFANGETLPVVASVIRRTGGSHEHGS